MNKRIVLWGVVFVLIVLLFLSTRTSGYTERIGVNVSMNTVQSMDGTVASCKQACDGNTSCKGFVYDQTRNRCELKSDLYSGRANIENRSVILYSK